MVKQCYSNELYHHGVKGQKWGVRRYQNEDGTLTSAGKQHYSEPTSENTKRSGLSDTQKATAKKVAIGAGVATGITAAAIGSAVYLSKHPEAVKALKSAGETVAIKAMYAGDKAKAAAPGIAKKAAKSLGKATIEAGKSAYTAALATVGTIAISKLATKTINTESKTEAESNAKKIAYESGKAAILTATQSKTYKSGNNKDGSKGSDISRIVGKPSNKADINGRDKAHWDNLMDRYREQPDQKAQIKAWRKKGYDLDQIEEALKHGGLMLEHGIYFAVRDEEELAHHGIKGQKWGVRRYQNYDGSLTDLGARRFAPNRSKYDKADRAVMEAKQAHQYANKYVEKMNKKAEKRQQQSDEKGTYKAQNKAERAKMEAENAKKLASAYTKAIDRKAEKRIEQYGTTAQKNYMKAKKSEERATKMANAYVNSMNKKAEKRQLQADKKETADSQLRANRAREEASRAKQISEKYIKRKKAITASKEHKEYVDRLIRNMSYAKS